ncbi:MAG: serine hydrolase domain-containing protein [Erysipelotrichaceae bacterium]
MSKEQEIFKIIEKFINQKVIAGASIAFVFKDDIKYHYLGQQGNIAPFNEIDITKEMFYDLASLTKVVATTTRIMQLIEGNKLKLDTKVSQIIAEFKFEDITIEQLLLHQGGFNPGLDNNEGLNKANVIARINQQIINVGNPTIYSDLGFIILGLIIEKIDNCDLETTFRLNIFEKLNMKQTSFLKKFAKELYLPTEVTEKRGIIQGQTHDPKSFMLKQSGSAGLFASIEDLAKFVTSFLFDNKVLNNTSKELLVNTNVNGRSYGWQVIEKSGSLFHTGFTGTSIAIDFHNKSAYIILTNRNFPNREENFKELQKEIAGNYFKSEE